MLRGSVIKPGPPAQDPCKRVSCSGVSYPREPSTSALLASWAKPVEFLTLEPAPDLAREYRFCGSIGMRAATTCGTCWRKRERPPTLATA